MRYKNVSDQDLNLVGFGFIKAGETIETDRPVFNPNFEEVKSHQTPEVKPSTEKK